MQKQRIIIIAVGVILALVVAYLVKVYLDQQRQVYQEEARREAAQSQANQTAVLVARQDIPRGTVINADMLESKIFPSQYLVPQAVTSLDRISGMIVSAPIAKGEQITLSKLAYSRQAGGLAEVTPVGKRAISINVDNLSSMAGMLKPGDYVDLIVLLQVPMLTQEGKQVAQVTTIPLLQNVLVLAVGQEIGSPSFARGGDRYSTEEEDDKQRGIPSLVTIALNPQEANLVTFIQEQGKIRLVLRSPADSQIAQLQMVTPNNLIMFLQQYLPRDKDESKSEQIEAIKPVEYVEIFRGLKREKIPYSE